MSVGTSGRVVVSLEQLTSKEREFIANSYTNPKDEDSVVQLLRDFGATFPNTGVCYDVMRRFLTNLKRKKRRKG